MKKLKPEDLAQLDRERFNTLKKSELIDLSERMRDLCIELYEKLNENSSNSSKPPSSDDPFKKGQNTKNVEPTEDQTEDGQDDAVDSESDEKCPKNGDKDEENDKQKRLLTARSGPQP